MSQAPTEYQRLFPDSIQLETPRVILRLMKKEDAAEFNKIAKNADVWKWFTKDLSDEKEMEQWIEDALKEREEGKRMPFTVIDRETKRICGCSSLGNISLFDRRVEIGWTWLGPEFIGTGLNRHAKFALLCYAFDVMKVERVEIKTDNLNERAKAALVKIGAKPEGVLRSHMQMHSNRRRDTIYYSILKDEWEVVKNSRFSEMV
ncbi:MAG: GNAT family N-acetyltransferase [Gemmatimonadaceae bacterium]|nr:GNAT family N-acetyltransferase [Chitinophagaceae bacterium]